LSFGSALFVESIRALQLLVCWARSGEQESPQFEFDQIATFPQNG
jgi:hypothetical protein